MTRPAVEGSALSGAVSYREGIALPADAVVEVKLSDVSLQDVAARGQRESAFEWAERRRKRGLANLDRAVQLGYAHRECVENDSDWDSVRQDPRFQEILARIGPPD